MDNLKPIFSHWVIGFHPFLRETQCTLYMLLVNILSSKKLFFYPYSTRLVIEVSIFDTTLDIVVVYMVLGFKEFEVFWIWFPHFYITDGVFILKDRSLENINSI